MKNNLFRMLAVGLVTLSFISGACAANPSDNKYSSLKNNGCLILNEYKNLYLELEDTYTFFGDVQYDSEYFEKVNYFEPYMHIPMFVTKLKAIKTGETKVLEDKWFIGGSDINFWPSKTIYEVTISE